MVNLVLISHSKSLAEATRELALQMASGSNVQIALAAGLDDAAHPYGTDPLHIACTIEEVYTNSGVILLTDMGSAVMNAEIALESLPAEMRKRVILSPAPFVEGAITAAAQAGAGADIEEVLREMASLLTGEAANTAAGQDYRLPDELALPDFEKREFCITVPNALGLHARPAARLVSLLYDYPAIVTVRKEGGFSVNAKSISQVATLSVKKGDVLIFELSGVNTEEIEVKLGQFTAANFGDPENARPTETDTTTTSTGHNEASGEVLRGIPASPGIYIGVSFVASVNIPDISTLQPEEPAAEWDTLCKAIAEVIGQYEAAGKKLIGKTTETEIFAFPLLLLRDQELLEKIKHLLVTTGQSAAMMWKVEMAHLEAAYQKGDSIYSRERAGDIREIARRVMLVLTGQSGQMLTMTSPGVLVLDDIGPGEVAGLNTDLVKGIITGRGGSTSHAYILARSLDIPCIVGIGEAILKIKNGATIAMDGEAGRIWLGNTANVQESRLLKKQSEVEFLREALRKEARRPAVTMDGTTYPVMANVSSRAEAAAAYGLGADGIGLLRSEFMYMNRARTFGGRAVPSL